FSLTDTIECNSPPTSNKSITITTDNPIEKDLLTHNFPRRISSSKFPINRFKIKKIPPKMAFPSNNESKFLDGSKKYTKIKINNISSNKILNDIDRKSTRLNSSHVSISYAVFCFKKKQRYVG